MVAFRGVHGRIELDQTSPALTLWPSCTWMARTTPVSNGWMILVRPLGTILPGAEATMSIVPDQAQASAAQNSTMMVAPIARPIGDGGVSTISSAAGRKASSSPRRVVRAPERDDDVGFGVAGAAAQRTSWSPACRRCSVA